VHSETNLLIFRGKKTLKWETTGSSETNVNFYQTTRCHLSEDNDIYVLTYYRRYDLHGNRAVVTRHLQKTKNA
jgi:hypothetical protein